MFFRGKKHKSSQSSFTTTVNNFTIEEYDKGDTEKLNETNYNTEYLSSFIDEYFADIPFDVEYILGTPPDGYYFDQDNGVNINSTNQSRALGVTSRTEENNIKIYLTPKLFTSKEDLFIILGNELVHAYHIYKG